VKTKARKRYVRKPKVWDGVEASKMFLLAQMQVAAPPEYKGTKWVIGKGCMNEVTYAGFVGSLSPAGRCVAKALVGHKTFPWAKKLAKALLGWAAGEPVSK